uniref:MARVEL domain-containing protein n=1 Tax=Panagrolaimus sp. ES5 TaxID=591445 RepID=A0AC34GTN6_9BILA
MSSTSYTPSKVPFEHYAPQYRCCCDSVHVRQGAKIIGVIQAVLDVVALITILSSHPLNSAWTMYEIASVFGDIIVLALLWVAIKKENPRFLLPYLVYESIMIIVSMGVIASGIAAFFDPNGSIGQIYNQFIDASLDASFKSNLRELNFNEETAVKLAAASTVFSCIIFVGIFAWFIHVVYKFYVYLCDLQQARENNDLSMQYAYKATVA